MRKIIVGAQVSLDGVMQAPGAPNEDPRVPSPAAPSARLVGLNHDVYRRDSTGTLVLNRIQALMHVSAASSAGTLEVVSRAGAVPLISPGTYPVSVRMFYPMWSRATLGLPPSR